MKRKRTVLALSLSIPLLFEGAAAAEGQSTYPPGPPPTEPGPAGPTTPGVPGPGDQLPSGPDQPKPTLPVTGGDVLALAVAGVAAVAVGVGLNSATGRRRYPVIIPSAASAAAGPPDGPRDTQDGTAVTNLEAASSLAAPTMLQEGSTVSTYEHQFRIAPEALEREDLLEGVEGPTRERLAAVLHSAATSYRATLDELEAARRTGAKESHGEPADRFADLGEHVAWVLRASHDAAEEERRRAQQEIEAARAEADSELARRRDEVSELERASAERLRVADEEAAAKLSAAREDAERRASTIRAEAEAQLSSLLEIQESLRVQLVEASKELRRSLDTLGTAEAGEAAPLGAAPPASPVTSE